MKNRTFVMLKPDAIERRLVGKIISRFEDKGFTLVEMIKQKATYELLDKHYAEHRDKPFYPDLISSIVDKPVICMVWESNIIDLADVDIIRQVRNMVGATEPCNRA